MKFCTACNGTFEDSLSFCPRDGEVLQESPHSIVGQVIDGKYQVESFIAQGGMGAVYLARHILIGDRVVIKTLRSEMRTNAEWLKRFQREGRAARAFRHPNSVTVYDLSAASDGQVYMVMEYVEGHTLDKELQRRGQFSPAEALDVLAPVADVLDAAHARGVVHRDLKPENIMLGRSDDGHEIVKVLDLGIAKMVGAGDVHASGATSLTVAGQILGTPYYMSPEQWGEMPRDGNPEVDGRTDIYSLGVIFFELVAGQKPLGGRTLSELRHKHVAAPLPTLSAVKPEVPEAFSRAVARAMAKDRGDRPATAGEFTNELRAALGLPARAARGTTTGPVHATSPPDVREADTANLQPHSDTSGMDVSRANTVLTSNLVPPAEGARETSAQHAHPATSGNVAAQRGTGRETVSASSFMTGAAPAVEASAHSGQAVVMPSPPVGAAAVPAPRRSAAPLIAGGVLALLLVLGVGGWFVWSRLNARTETAATNAPAGARTTNAAPSNAAATTAPAPKVEALSYWLEPFDERDKESGRRVADTSATLGSGQAFRFHFTSRERGYLYIIVPGKEGNAPTLMLTAQGAGQLKSNLVAANADFVFPFGGDKLRLDKNPGAEDYTVIFSPTPLMSPSFLTGKFMRELTPAEVKELEDLRAQHKANAPALDVKEDGGARRVAVNVPETATAAGQPVIFDVRINHQ